MTTWIEPKKNISEREKSPHKDGIQKGSEATDDSKAENSNNLLGQRPGCGAGSGMGMSGAYHRF
jgi:hypothetical protein